MASAAAACTTAAARHLLRPQGVRARRRLTGARLDFADDGVEVVAYGVGEGVLRPPLPACPGPGLRAPPRARAEREKERERRRGTRRGGGGGQAIWSASNGQLEADHIACLSPFPICFLATVTGRARRRRDRARAAELVM
jgi:hypothetical protein